MNGVRKLIEAVERNDLSILSGHDVKIALGMHGFSYMHSIMHHGSLDAAKSLHDALLPGGSAVIQTNGTVQTIGPNHERHTGVAVDAPARAWLIAILKAYEATHA